MRLTNQGTNLGKVDLAVILLSHSEAASLLGGTPPVDAGCPLCSDIAVVFLLPAEMPQVDILDRLLSYRLCHVEALLTPPMILLSTAVVYRVPLVLILRHQEGHIRRIRLFGLVLHGSHRRNKVSHWQLCRQDVAWVLLFSHQEVVIHLHLERPKPLVVCRQEV